MYLFVVHSMDAVFLSRKWFGQENKVGRLMRPPNWLMRTTAIKNTFPILMHHCVYFIVFYIFLSYYSVIIINIIITAKQHDVLVRFRIVCMASVCYLFVVRCRSLYLLDFNMCILYLDREINIPRYVNGDLWKIFCAV